MATTGLPIGPYALGNRDCLPFFSTLPLTADWTIAAPNFVGEGISGIAIAPTSDVPWVTLVIPNTVKGSDSDLLTVGVGAPYIGGLIRSAGDTPVNIFAPGVSASYASWTTGTPGTGPGLASLALLLYTKVPAQVPMTRVSFQKYVKNFPLAANPAATTVVVAPAYGRRFFYMMAKGTAGAVVTLEGFFLSGATESFVTMSQQTIPVSGVVEFSADNTKRFHGVRITAVAAGAVETLEYYLGMDDEAP